MAADTIAAVDTMVAAADTMVAAAAAETEPVAATLATAIALVEMPAPALARVPVPARRVGVPIHILKIAITGSRALRDPAAVVSAREDQKANTGQEGAGARKTSSAVIGTGVEAGRTRANGHGHGHSHGHGPRHGNGHGYNHGRGRGQVHQRSGAMVVVVSRSMTSGRASCAKRTCSTGRHSASVAAHQRGRWKGQRAAAAA